MEEGVKKPEYIVIDTNILISSLVKQDGYTQALLSILLVQKDIKLMVPESIRSEINAHIQEISRKSGLPARIIAEVTGMIFKAVITAEEKVFIPEIKEALGLVSDKNDAPFAGLAIKLKPSVILTYNKKHFDAEGLGKLGVKVLEPHELAKYMDMAIGVNKKVRRKGGIIRLISKLYLMRTKRGNS